MLERLLDPDRVVIVGAFRELSESDIGELWGRVPPTLGAVTIVAVAEPYRHSDYAVLTHCGLIAVHPGRATGAACAEARGHAQRLLASVPPQLAVEYLVVPTWSRVPRHLLRRGYEHALLADRPQRLRDRLWLRFAPRRSLPRRP